MISKCPYHDCQRDFNQEWGSDRDLVYPTKSSSDGDGLWIESYQCKFCSRKFHEIYRAKYILEKDKIGRDVVNTLRGELLFTFPSVKTQFTSKNIPSQIKNFFNEAERCRSIGSLTGVGACLRKTIYAICDHKGVDGTDYREKISKLPVNGKYQELLKQIKWLGDNTTKPGDEKYTLVEADLALEILPVLMEELFSKDEKIDQINKILSKVKSK